MIGTFKYNGDFSKALKFYLIYVSKI